MKYSIRSMRFTILPFFHLNISQSADFQGMGRAFLQISLTPCKRDNIDKRRNTVRKSKKTGHE
ncbi:MAG: hypothetical protein A2V65_06600 [Deltaproteobacteria bacterium RBG_13_49_15]|nr:MAG: hypothetical protein A2V65_06600 [Deltaproteobacteria bacterium RBG_13_49_15]